jgi:hypothetical protein
MAHQDEATTIGNMSNRDPRSLILPVLGLVGVTS